MKLLIVDDDSSIIQAVSEGLKHRYRLDSAPDGKRGLSLARTREYDAILLDINLPGMDGFTLCREIRKSGITTPILMLSGQFEDAHHKAQGLDCGADDYVLKPLNLEELAARLRALSRRGNLGPSATGDTLEAGEITLHLPDRVAKRGGKIVPLKRKEFDLLEYFVRHPNRILTREMIFNHVWDSNANAFNNTVDVHIKYLRDKIDRPFRTYMIQTVYGLGYKLVT